MKPYKLIGFMALGVTAASFNSMSQPVYGASLTPVTLEAAQDWTPHPWQIYLRGGGIVSWEATLRPNPDIRNSEPGDPQADLRWPAWEGLPWELEIDGEDLIFGIEDEQVVVSEIDGVDLVREPLIFDGLKLWASATTLEDRVSEGTETFVTVEEINGMATANPNDVSCSATASTLGIEQACQTAYSSNENIVQMKGIAGMRWKDGLDPHQSNPQSHLQIFIEAFELRPNADSPSTGVVLGISDFTASVVVDESSAQIPEPSVIFGLFGIGTLSLGLKRKQET